MLPGHTKFAPDAVARAISGEFNGSDVFNMGMLLDCARRCSSVQAYDAETMYHWKAATKTLFGAIDNVMSYRQFFILPEDVDVVFGDSVPLPPNMEPFPSKKAPLRSHAALQAAAKAIYMRSLKKVALDCLANRYRAGDGSGSLPEPPSRIHPDSVDSFLRVRLFMRRNESEPVWREQIDWMRRDITLQKFNDSLRELRPCSQTPDHGREHYGKKLSGIAEQYERYVPPQYVPDGVELYSTDMTAGMGIGSSAHQSVLTDHYTTTETPPASTLPVKHMRWNSAAHTSVLRAILISNFSGAVPSSTADVKRLAELMQQHSPATSGFVWDGGKLRQRGK